MVKINGRSKKNLYAMSKKPCIAVFFSYSRGKGKKQSVRNLDVRSVEKQWHSSFFDEINPNNGHDASRTFSKDKKNKNKKRPHTVYTNPILIVNINTSALIRHHYSNQMYKVQQNKAYFIMSRNKGL